MTEAEQSGGAPGSRTRADGSGLYCVAGAASDADAVGQLCRGWTAPPLPPAAEQAEIMHACTRLLPSTAHGKDGGKAARRPSRTARPRPASISAKARVDSRRRRGL